jgi:hypothetical protein
LTPHSTPRRLLSARPHAVVAARRPFTPDTLPNCYGPYSRTDLSVLQSLPERSGKPEYPGRSPAFRERLGRHAFRALIALGLLQSSPRTVRSDWQFAKVWLTREPSATDKQVFSLPSAAGEPSQTRTNPS